MKLVIISDAHFPVPYSMLYRQIIKTERPDHVVFLGDNVQAGQGEDALKLHTKFIREIASIHPASKTIYLIGDNDYRRGHGIDKYVSSHGFMNRDPFVFDIGNMSFFHGNVERHFSFGNGSMTRILEKVGHRLFRWSGGLGKELLPSALAGLVRVMHGTARKRYLFLGHIHLLRKRGRNIFCGTLRAKKIVYEPGESLGYVTVRHSGFRISSPDSIRIHSLVIPKIQPI